MKKFEERESLVFENNGQRIFAVFHRPLIQSKAPAVLICHGLAGHKTGRYRVYVALSERLAQEGIASLRFDFRGTGDSEGALKEMTFEDEVGDALIALERLFQSSSIDPARVGVFGRSVGGVVAILAAGRRSDVKSLGVWAPLFDGKQWNHNWELVKAGAVSTDHADELMRVNGQVASKAFLHELFSVKMDKELVSLNALPFLHIHGDKDAVINVTHADLYQTCRQNALAESKFIRLATDHDFSDSHERKQAIEETVKWFKDTL